MPTANKPTVEETIIKHLDGAMRETATEFAAYMQANKMPLRWGSKDRYKALYKGKVICWMDMNQHDINNKRTNKRSGPIKWLVSPCLAYIAEYERLILSEGWQDFICDNFARCVPCNPDNNCAGGKELSILGKDLNGICQSVFFHNIRVSFADPDEVAIGRIKRLLECEKAVKGNI